MESKFNNTICPCCDMLVGEKYALALTNEFKGKVCAGCARPDHRYNENREIDHMDPDWVAGRHEW